MALSKKCEFLCTCAESALGSICTKTKNGDITLDELSMMKKRNDHVELLFEESNKDVKEVTALKQSLKERYEERDVFMRHVEKLGQLCQSVTIQVEGT